VTDFIAGGYYRIALPSPITPIDRVKNKRALRNGLQSMQKPMSRKRDRRPNLHRNTGNGTRILRPAAAPTRHPSWRPSGAILYRTIARAPTL